MPLCSILCLESLSPKVPYEIPDFYKCSKGKNTSEESKLTSTKERKGVTFVFQESHPAFSGRVEILDLVFRCPRILSKPWQPKGCRLFLLLPLPTPSHLPDLMNYWNWTATGAACCLFPGIEWTTGASSSQATGWQSGLLSQRSCCNRTMNCCCNRMQDSCLQNSPHLQELKLLH